MNKEKVCNTCEYYETYEGVCANAFSEHCADFTLEDDSCKVWELRKDKKVIYEELQKPFI